MSYSSSSAQDRLDAVRSAIGNCLASQSYSIRGRQQVMAQLATLRAMEKELQEEADIAADGASAFSVGILSRPT